MPRLPVWRAAYPDIPLEVIGTDAVLDLRAGEADVAIRYGRAMPSDLPAREMFRDTFFPVCSPEVLAKGNRPIRRAADLLDYPLIHFDWAQWDKEGPTWQRWLATARSVDPDLPEVTRPWEASFREELHAIEAVVAGQGIAICSDVIVSHDLRTGSLMKAHDLALPGYGYYLVHLPNHPRQIAIETFANWIRSSE
jgi:LysR family transcriptional regulator, glycine cleavage system transcriptional activator